MASANMTTTTHAVFIPEVWADGVLDAVEYGSVVQKRVTREYEGDIKKMGDTVHVQHMVNLQAAAKAASTDIEFEATTDTELTIAIDQHYYAAFLIEDIVGVQARLDLRARYERKLGYALARQRETTLTAHFDGFANNVGTLGVELTYEDFVRAWQYLADAGLLESSSDPGEDFSLFLSPAAWAAMLKVDTFINRDYNKDADAIGRARVGDLLGFPVFMSNLLESDAAGQHDCAVMHKGALALAVQAEIPVRSDYLIEKLADAVVAHNIYGTKVLTYKPERYNATRNGAQAAAAADRGVHLKTV